MFRRHLGLFLTVGILAGLLVSLATIQRAWQVNQLAMEATSRLQGVRPLSVPDLLGLTERPLRQDWRDLIEKYDLWLDRAGTDPAQLQPGVFIRQNLLLMSGQPERALAVPVLNSLGLYLRAVAYGQQHNLPAAAMILREIPDSRATLALAGRAAWDNRFDPDTELAIGAMKMVLDLGAISLEQQIDAYRILSYAYEYARQPTAAIEAAQAWVKITDADCVAVTRLITLYLRQADPASAGDLLRQQTDTNRQCPAYFRQMAMTQDQLGNLESAVGYYQHALADEPSDVYLNMYFGNLLYRRKEYSEAIPYLTIAARSTDPDLQHMATDLLTRISLEPSGK